jgi:hypothetical protein
VASEPTVGSRDMVGCMREVGGAGSIYRNRRQIYFLVYPWELK